MADSRDILGKNRKFTGTTGIKLPEGTTAQRVDEAGQLRFNSTTNLAEYYDGTDWKSIDAPPTITGFTVDGGGSVTSYTMDNEASGDASIVINGSNFDTTSATVVFEPESGGSNVAVQTITRTNSSSFTVTVTRADFLESGSPYAIKLTNGSGLAATLASAITADDAAPAFSTAADTNIGTVQNGDTSTQFDANLTTVAATDTDTAQTVVHSISAGSLPNGMSIESDGTFTGTCSSLPSSSTEYTFTVQAVSGGTTVTRQYKINGIASAYMAATGGTELTSGDYKTHVFTSPGTFTVTAGGDAGGSNSVEYMVVAGGAGGGGGHAGSGGAGGMRYNYPAPAIGGLPVSATSYPITVGGGGAGRGSGPGDSTGIIGGSGGQSVFSTITSAGGGGGAYSEDTNRPGANANPGGSGGGGGHAGQGGGTGNQPPVSPPQGNNGGGGYGSPVYPGGGGGGRGGVGGTPGNGTQPGGSAGAGEGAPLDFMGGPSNAPSYGTSGPSPTARYFAGGGGGGVHTNTQWAPGGPGGGGRGGSNGPQTPGVSGTSNTGGGGGGTAGNGTSGAGGSGIVAIRYKFQ